MNDIVTKVIFDYYTTCIEFCKDMEGFRRYYHCFADPDEEEDFLLYNHDLYEVSEDLVKAINEDIQPSFITLSMKLRSDFDFYSFLVSKTYNEFESEQTLYQEFKDFLLETDTVFAIVEDNMKQVYTEEEAEEQVLLTNTFHFIKNRVYPKRMKMERGIHNYSPKYKIKIEK